VPKVISLRGGGKSIAEVTYSDKSIMTVTSKDLSTWSKLNPSATLSDVADFVCVAVRPKKQQYGDVYMHVHSKDPLRIAILIVNPGEKVVTEGDGAWWRRFAEARMA